MQQSRLHVVRVFQPYLRAFARLLFSGRRRLQIGPVEENLNILFFWTVKRYAQVNMWSISNEDSQLNLNAYIFLSHLVLTCMAS